MDAIETAIENREQLEREAKAAEAAKDADRQEKGENPTKKKGKKVSNDSPADNLNATTAPDTEILSSNIGETAPTMATGSDAGDGNPQNGGSNPRKQNKTASGTRTSTQAPKVKPAKGSGKRKRPEVDRDFAEGGEELEYHPRPSKSRAVEK